MQNERRILISDELSEIVKNCKFKETKSGNLNPGDLFVFAIKDVQNYGLNIIKYRPYIYEKLQPDLEGNDCREISQGDWLGHYPGPNDKNTLVFILEPDCEVID